MHTHVQSLIAFIQTHVQIIAQVYMHYRTHGTLYPCFLLYFLYFFRSCLFSFAICFPICYSLTLLTPFSYSSLSPFNSFTTLLNKASHLFIHVMCTRQISVTNFLSIMHLVLSSCNSMLTARILLPPFFVITQIMLWHYFFQLLVPLVHWKSLSKKT